MATLRDLIQQQTPTAPILGSIDLSGGGMPVLPAPVMPSAVQDPRTALTMGDPLDVRASQANADLYRRQNPTQPHGLLGKIGHVAASIGNALGDIVSPETMALIPGTQLHNEVKIAQDKSELERVQALRNEQSQEAATDANTAYTTARPAIEQSKIDQKQQAVRDRVSQQAAMHGQKVTWDENGAPAYEDDPTLLANAAQQATIAWNKAKTEVAEAGNDPTSPKFQLAAAHLRVAEANAHAANIRANAYSGMVGIAGQRLGFDEDKAYNPQPTGAERTKGDLATSAAHYVDVMHEVRQAHPDLFGPGQGQATKLQAWLGSQDPDAQRYLAAATVAKDHLTAVFGARSKYALEGTGTLFDPKMNNAAFEGEYGDLRKSIGTFQDAGTTHGRGTVGYAARQGEARNSAPAPRTSAPTGADNEVYVRGKLVGHTVGGRYVPLAK